MSGHFKIALSFASEDEAFVEKVYHYLKAEGINAFFAPSPEGQTFLIGKNQREVFYDIFGLRAEYVALFVSKYYIAREVPMEEASIAFARHSGDGKVIPVYLDGTALPVELFDPKKMNYFKAGNPAVAASQLAAKIKADAQAQQTTAVTDKAGNVMHVKGNKAKRQIFVQNINGSIEL